MIKFITSSAGLNLLINGSHRLVPRDHKHYDTILNGLKNKDESVVNLLDEYRKKIEDFDGVDFQVVAGELLFRGQPYENQVVLKYIESMIEKGYSSKPLIRFLEKVEQNPNPQSVEDLWTFMMNSGLAISDDGDIIAFKYVTKVSDLAGTDEGDRLKKINAEYTDSYSLKYDYTPGRVVEVPRHTVEYNPNKDCGVGLHIGDYSYVRGQKYVLTVKFSPADVCSIGRGEQRKIRVCRFMPVSVIDKDHIDNTGYKEPVYSFKEGNMTFSDYKNSYFKGNPVNVTESEYCDNPSAEHWSK